MKRNVIQLASVHIDATTDRKTIWIVDAHGDDGKRFIVHADEKLTALVELELIGAAERSEQCGAREMRGGQIIAVLVKVSLITSSDASTHF